MNNTIAPAFLTRKEAAEYLGVTAKWLAETGRDIGIPSKRFGGHVRYAIAELDQWAAQQ